MKASILKTSFVFILIHSFYVNAAPSFDCSKAKSFAEISICNDPDLEKLDNELAKIYKEAKGKSADIKEFNKQQNIAWTYREKECKNKECLIAWYVNRKKELVTQGQNLDAKPINLSQSEIRKEIKISNLNVNVSYNYSGKNCKEQNNDICLTEREYESLCKGANGATKHAGEILADISNAAAKYLVKNGKIEQVIVYWNDRSTKYKCRLGVTVSGIYKGSSSREEMDGGISRFIFNDKNKLLADYAMEWHY